MSDATTMVIFGASGDLTSRLLLPALGQLLTIEPDREVRLFGAGVDDWDDERWRTTVRRAFDEMNADAAYDRVKDTTYHKLDITDPSELTSLFAMVGPAPALYFAVPPAIAAASCEAMTKIDLPEGTVIALEKPFGTSQASAHELNEVLAKLLPENQVFRVDHFLGRSMTLNVLGVRFANRVLEPVWKGEHIESILICYDEQLGLEGRARYYDKAGALRDMIQSHLLQVMAVVAMEPPATLSEQDLRDATTAALRATHVWNDDPITSSRRGRYTAGTIDGRQLPSYTEEHGVVPENNTETLAEVTFEVATERWAGVPITLRSGKAIGAPRRHIQLRFKPVRHVPTGFTGSTDGTTLTFELGPDRMSLELNMNDGGDEFELRKESLSADLGAGALKAYAEVLQGILDGDATLSVRGDAAEQCWRIVQPVLDAWAKNEVPLQDYAAGSAGPEGWADN
ncbi:glucose-6-phosphate dehydrogenase [Microbacterium sediminicola]|uniref:Glucose-6-phosphate dehydrogenase n=1 Tax=Microbacterium sediminicola TaxID=415210 RepID=A0ABN2IBG7_9MICO